MAVVGPGAAGAEAVGATPLLEWDDDSSEDQYDVVVFDSFGEVVFETTRGGHTGAGNPSVTYEGEPLQAGMYYQFRVTSLKDGVPLSRTQPVEGVFYAE